MGPRNCLCAQPSQNTLPCSALEVQWSPQPESILIPCKHTRKSRKCPDGHRAWKDSQGPCDLRKPQLQCAHQCRGKD